MVGGTVDVIYDGAAVFPFTDRPLVEAGRQPSGIRLSGAYPVSQADYGHAA